METVLGIALLAALVALVVVLVRARPAGSGAETQVLQAELRSLAERLGSDSLHLAQRLEGIESRMTRTQTAGQEMAAGIFETLGDVRTATQQVAEQAKTFTSLQDLLAAPKARGGLGEALLEELLRQVLPPSAYSIQHRFSDGLIVDAAVRAGGHLVCIDSKFPLPNYQKMCAADNDTDRRAAERAFARDVNKHIEDISNRYIVPDEGTLDFALMYIPAEGVYSEVLRLEHAGRQLFDIALEKRVVPMAPLTLYGYLQTLLIGLRCLKIETNAEAVLRSCERLQRDVETFAADYEVLGRHLGNARNKYEDASRGLNRLRTRVDQTLDLTDDEVSPGAPRSDERPALEAVEPF